MPRKWITRKRDRQMLNMSEGAAKIKPFFTIQLRKNAVEADDEPLLGSKLSAFGAKTRLGFGG